MRHALILLLLAAAGCAAHDDKPDCRDPVNELDMRCGPRPAPTPRSDLVLICQNYGASRHCWYINRADLDEFLRELER